MLAPSSTVWFTADKVVSLRTMSYFILVSKMKDDKDTYCLLCDQYLKNSNSTPKYNKYI